MQKNDMTLKRKVLIDGINVDGLVTCGDVVDSEDAVDVPSFNRKTKIKGGVKTLAPIALKYKVARDTTTQKTLNDWFNNNTYSDVDIINCDATGAEVNRWTLRDCECSKYSEGAYDAGSITYFGIEIEVICTTTPIFLQA